MTETSAKNVAVAQATKYGMLIGGAGILGFVGYKFISKAYKNSPLGKIGELDDKLIAGTKSAYKSVVEDPYQKSKDFLSKKSNQRKLAEGALLVGSPAIGVGYQVYKNRDRIARTTSRNYQKYTPRAVRNQVSVKTTTRRVNTTKKNTKKVLKKLGF